jgi:hypothetical protein
MADFKNVKDRIDDDITENGQGLITGNILNAVLDVMLDAIGAVLDLKVDAVEGKGLSTNDFTNELKNKLNNMPYITAYDYQNHRVTLNDGNGHSQVYQLTPYVPIPDYYIGWTSGTKSAFAALNESQLKQLATSYMVANNPTYQHACTNIIFFVMFKTDKAPKNGSLVAGGLSSPISAADFLAGGDCPHEPVTIDGTTYKIYGIRNSELVGENNIITINFN